MTMLLGQANQLWFPLVIEAATAVVMVIGASSKKFNPGNKIFDCVCSIDSYCSVSLATAAAKTLGLNLRKKLKKKVKILINSISYKINAVL